MRHIIVPLIVISVLAGCKEKESASTTPQQQPAQALDPAAANASAALVTVNGKTLSRADAQREVDTRLAGMAQNESIPKERLAAMRDRMLRHVVDQFIMRTLLLEEAEKEGITVTPEDEQQAFSKIAEALPEGTTPDQVMKESPMGEARMREEVLTGIRINKLLAKTMPESEKPTPEEIAQFKEENAERLVIPETAKARHILLKVSPQDTDEQKAAKKQTIDDLHKQLTEGADFAELAKKHSECPSAPKGGDLGMFSRGRMVKPFEEAVFTQEVGKIGPVVETQFGYHIIEVLQRNPSGAMTDEKVAQLVQGRKRQEAMKSLLDDLKAKADIVMEE
jgi:peptidyl-prolyl cis-trans isomerase C